jgi:hypothetical protein
MNPAMNPSLRPGDRWLAGAASLAAHGAFLCLLLLSAKPPASSATAPPVLVDLVAPPVIQNPAPAQTPTPTPTVSAAPAPANPARRPPAAKPRPAPSPAAARAADYDSGAHGVQPSLSDAELAGASAAGEGAPGGACDMARHVQNALRKDPMVRSAVAGASANGRALLVWNGDWVQSLGEDGKGLSAVREAIMWDVAFAPAACRAQAVRGLITMNLGPGSPRLVLGQAEWRWSDLLHASPTG